MTDVHMTLVAPGVWSGLVPHTDPEDNWVLIITCYQTRLGKPVWGFAHQMLEEKRGHHRVLNGMLMGCEGETYEEARNLWAATYSDYRLLYATMEVPE